MYQKSEQVGMCKISEQALLPLLDHSLVLVDKLGISFHYTSKANEPHFALLRLFFSLAYLSSYRNVRCLKRDTSYSQRTYFKELCHSLISHRHDTFYYII